MSVIDTPFALFSKAPRVSHSRSPSSSGGVEIVVQAAGISDLDGPDEVRAKVAATCASAEDPRLVAERIAQLMGVAGATGAHDETFWAVRELVQALVSSSPIVLVIEDLHWAEPTLLDLLEHLVGSVHGTPVLLLCTARPELIEERPSWASPTLRSSSIRLEPLSVSDTAVLIDELIAQRVRDDAMTSRLSELSGGNPLFVGQMAAAMLEQAAPERSGANDGSVKDWPVIPATIAAVLDARLDALPARERGVLERGAIEGSAFHVGSVRSMTPEPDRETIWPALLSLVRRGLIQPDRSLFIGDQAYRFGHALIRDAAERRLPKAIAAELHERSAEWLVACAGVRAAEFDPIVGHHLERAVRLRRELRPADGHAAELAPRAADRLAAAGRAARDRGDATAARDLIGRAIALRTADHPALLGDLDELSRVDEQLGHLDRALALLDRMLTESRRRGDRGAEAMAIARSTLLRNSTDPLHVGAADLRSAARQAISVLEELGDHDGLARSWTYMAFAEMYETRYDRAAETFERAATEAVRADDVREALEQRANALVCRFFGSTTPTEGIRLAETLLDDSADHRYARGFALACQAGFLAMLGDFDRARDLNDQAGALVQDMGPEVVSYHAQGVYEIAMLAGDLQAAEAAARTSRRLLEAMGDPGRASSSVANLAEILAEQGHIDEAEAEVERAKAMTPESDLGAHIVIGRAMCKALGARGDLGRAVAAGREALSLSEQTEWPEIRAGVRVDLARILSTSGARDEARRLAHQAVGLLERKGDVVRAVRARILLVSLTQ